VWVGPAATMQDTLVTEGYCEQTFTAICFKIYYQKLLQNEDSGVRSLCTGGMQFCGTVTVE